jgi:predicted nuclease of predicted toxin-antitoxin system
MKLKLDENLSRHLKPLLTGLGHDVLTAAALREERMLLTLDLEFADLRKYPPGSHPGIILFRPPSFGPLSVNKFIIDFVNSADLSELTSCVAIVDPVNVRVRSPEKRP